MPQLNRAALTAEINNYIKTNGIQSITAAQLNGILLDIIESCLVLEDDGDGGNPYYNCSVQGLYFLPPFPWYAQIISCFENNLTSLPSLSKCLSLIFFSANSNNISSCPSLTGLVNLRSFDLSANTLTSFPSLSGLIKLSTLFVNNNSFNQATVDGILTDLLQLVTNGGQSGGACYIENTSVPGAAGNIAILGLIANGWTVTHD